MLCEMAGRKRKLDEWDVSEMEESEGATVHGVFTELSPVKVSRRNASVRYYDGRMADGQKSARLVCFDPALTFETFELQRPMYVRCKPHMPLLNLNRTHAPSEGDGRTIHDNIYKYIYIYRQRRC